MSILGKLLLGAAGYAFGGPIDALLSAIAGHPADEREGAAAADGTQRVGFTVGVIVLSAKMARVDGEVSTSEILAFREMFQVPPEEERNVERLFNLAKRDPTGYEVYARQIKRLLDGERALLERLLDALFHIAKSDGEVASTEIDFLRSVASLLGFAPAEFSRIRTRHLGPDPTDPYSVLGVDRDASTELIRAAYRRQLLENHPDRLIAQGRPAECVAIGSAKTARLNGAWDQIARERGLP